MPVQNASFVKLYSSAIQYEIEVESFAKTSECSSVIKCNTLKTQKEKAVVKCNMLKCDSLVFCKPLYCKQIY